jgi:hypothetical protein
MGRVTPGKIERCGFDRGALSKFSIGPFGWSQSDT